MTLPLALSQIGYPQAGDVDDCWVVATVWAALAAGETYKPGVTAFRAAAHNPDRPGPTGGDLGQILLAVEAMWPDAVVDVFESADWTGFISKVKAGSIATVAVLSGALPPELRYNFYGPHQIAVASVGGQLYVMNPLMRNGAPLKLISEYALKKAVIAVAGSRVLAAVFTPRGSGKMPNVTVTEAALARILLRAIGADDTKPAMVRAAVAWFRQESGLLSRVVNNNAFNIKSGVADKLSSGVDYRGFLIFPSMRAGWLAAAMVLNKVAPLHGYGTVLTAAHNNNALQFLGALARSGWSESHYGWVPGANPRGMTNHLVQVYVGLQLIFKLA